MTFTHEMQINCTPTTAFDLMADVRNETRWNDDVSRAEMTTDEPVGRGSQFVTYHGRPLGQIESTITTFNRPERLEYGATSNAMDLTISATFSEIGSGTLLRATFDPKPKGMMKLLLPVMMPMIRRDIAKQHENLKALCESQTRSTSTERPPLAT